MPSDVNWDGKVDMKDVILVDSAFGRQWGTSSQPLAYSTSFEFQVPNDGDANVFYYILVRFFISEVPSGKSDAIRNVRVDAKLILPNQVDGLFNVMLGQMRQGYHLLECEYFESVGGGLLNFTVNAENEYAQLDRFRMYVPNYSNTEVRYTVKTYTYFPSDTFFLGSSASQYLYVDDYIQKIVIDAGLIWQDWIWDTGSYGAIHAWRDGFIYPLGWQSGWNIITFTYANKDSGLLDFQCISQTNQPAKIGKPRFWARISPPASPYPSGNIRHLKIYDVSSWAGSSLASTVGSSKRLMAADLKVLVNATDTNTFYPIPQEAEVTLILDLPSYQWPLNSLQDIGLHINVTYTYFDEHSLQLSHMV